jgi:hypothetical protein
MKDARQTSVTIQGLTVTREDVINTLCFPASPLAQRPETDGLTLPTLVRDNPAALQAVGLVQLEVYGPTCLDVERGTWSVRPRMIWVDQESGVPVDSATVMFVDTLPESLSSSKPNELIQFLPPTYCTRREDAERLVQLLQEAGPTRGCLTK